MKGTLYIVATPIGNLEDITLRALRILKESDVILAEDTRESGTIFENVDLRKLLFQILSLCIITSFFDIVNICTESFFNFW